MGYDNGQENPVVKQEYSAAEQETAGKERFRNQEADVNAKQIFGNHTLCAQFLRDYAGLPMLADVQPEDIEDVTERYHLFREVEFQTDTVKKVRLHKKVNELPGDSDVYILSLIEHKSSVDYDVTMQILKYMVCIWENEAAGDNRTEWECTEKKRAESGNADGMNRAEEKGEEGDGKTEKGEAGSVEEVVADFAESQKRRKNKNQPYRYTPIFPIVYYEGSGEWTAARNLKDRILLGDLFEAYIPDFTYKLVTTQDYTSEELLSREDAISLLMLLNKIQQAKDFEGLSALPEGKLNEIMQKAPVDVAEIIISAVRSLCRRLNLTEEETTGLMREMEAGNMGYLWENMEKMDIQLERRNTAEQRQRAERAEQQAASAEQKAAEAEQEKLALIRLLIATCHKQGMSREAILNLLETEAGLEKDRAEELLKS